MEAYSQPNCGISADEIPQQIHQLLHSAVDLLASTPSACRDESLPRRVIAAASATSALDQVAPTLSTSRDESSGSRSGGGVYLPRHAMAAASVVPVTTASMSHINHFFCIYHTSKLTKLFCIQI